MEELIYSLFPPPFSPQLCGLLRMIGVLASPTHKDFLCSCEAPRVQRGDEDCRRLFSAQLSGTRSNLRWGKRCPEVPAERRLWVPGSLCPSQGCFPTGMWLLGQGVQERPNQGNSLLFDFFSWGFDAAASNFRPGVSRKCRLPDVDCGPGLHSWNH